MTRTGACLIGLILLVGGGFVHGLWSDRWQPPQELAQTIARINALPEDIDDWKGEAVKQDAEALTLTGAIAHYSRSFADPNTGERVLVILLAGKPARMSVHRPEHCYRAAGYELAGSPLHLTVTPANEPPTEMFTGLFTRDDPSKGLSQLRIFWTWYAGGKWDAPDNPRWAFARRRVLYKLYVIRVVNEPTPIPTDPCIRLLGQLLPVLNRKFAD